jgi:hypothetical protein
VITNRPKLVDPAAAHATTALRRFQADVDGKHGSSWTSERHRSADGARVRFDPREQVPR